MIRPVCHKPQRWRVQLHPGKLLCVRSPASRNKTAALAAAATAVSRPVSRSLGTGGGVIGLRINYEITCEEVAGRQGAAKKGKVDLVCGKKGLKRVKRVEMEGEREKDQWVTFV